MIGSSRAIGMFIDCLPRVESIRPGVSPQNQPTGASVAQVRPLFGRLAEFAHRRVTESVCFLNRRLGGITVRPPRESRARGPVTGAAASTAVFPGSLTVDVQLDQNKDGRRLSRGSFLGKVRMRAGVQK